MSDIFRSAFSNISSNWNLGSSDSHNNNNGNDMIDIQFVGQTVDLAGHKLRIESVIAEGGFGFVFRVRDINTTQVLALKRLIAANGDAVKDIENEINVLSRLQTHNHIVQFIASGVINHNIYLLLSEYCGCGSLKDITLPIQNHQQLNRITYQISLAIERLHSLGIIHRDLKIENILFDARGYVKLCNFVSATTNTYSPDLNWTTIQRSLLEDEMCRYTTLMYRPPEILDTYLHFAINTAMDIWAFGCLLYTIKFARHPFEDSTKLHIINCNYSIPSSASDTDIIVQIIRSCIIVEPNDRITIYRIIKLMEDNFVDLMSPCVVPSQPTPTTTSPVVPLATNSNESNLIEINHNHTIDVITIDDVDNDIECLDDKSSDDGIEIIEVKINCNQNASTDLTEPIPTTSKQYTNSSELRSVLKPNRLKRVSKNVKLNNVKAAMKNRIDKLTKTLKELERKYEKAQAKDIKRQQ